MTEAVELGHLSYSRLSSYIKCGESYRLRFIEGVEPEPSGAAMAGRAVHSVIEEMLLDGWFVRPDVVEDQGAKLFQVRFDEGLAEVGGPDAVRWGGQKRLLRDENNKPVLDEDGAQIKVGENYPWMCKMGPTWVKRAGAQLRRDLATGIQVVETSIEQKVSRFLDDPGSLLITGIVDVMVFADNEDKPRVRDWKTGTFVDAMQLANYAWLLAQAGIEVSIGEIAYLRGTSPETQLRVYNIDPWKSSVKRMYADAEKGIRADHFQLTPSSWCGSCWVRRACEYGRTLD